MSPGATGPMCCARCALTSPSRVLISSSAGKPREALRPDDCRSDIGPLETRLGRPGIPAHTLQGNGRANTHWRTVLGQQSEEAAWANGPEQPQRK